ncbi:lysophospholipase D GDPD1 isoform X1 [Parasteatoda tepidariorum]|uniref:lysophospholipase D GDPD1 isoform X1 n=2 Tax=Parasteatoda tepidariorum TaxID=114398 RepID=UPI001C72718B|nr:lysophospholipase D GDPD1 isoform X2 [Parasteatoda tepidariorum]
MPTSELMGVINTTRILDIQSRSDELCSSSYLISYNMLIMYVIAIVGGYVASSLILFKFPNLIHKRRKLKFFCPHISHRGGAGEAFENTIGAFDNALRQRTDMLEIDLHLTKDEQVVVSHDNNLLRVTGVNVNISDSNYEDLPKLRLDLCKNYNIGQPKDKDVKIPLLKDVFERFPEVPINIDIKVNNDMLIEKVNDLIREHERENITVWGNFSNAVTKKCFKINPQIPIYFSASRVICLVLFTYSGLLPFIPFKESCLELFMPSVLLKNPSMKGSRDKFWSPYVVWLIEKLLLRKSLFDHLLKRGIQTYLWVLNEEEDFEKAFELGAVGVMTDYPTKLRKFLERKSPINDSH